MRKSISAILKSFVYILILGICQIICAAIASEDVLLSTVLADLMFVVVVIAIIKITNQNIKERLKLNTVTLKNIGVIIIVSLVLNVVFQSIQFLFPEAMRNELMLEVNESFYELKNVLSFITIVIVAPLAEEILFRGLILGVLEKAFNTHIAIILQAILFGIIHGNIIWAIIAFLSAVYYGYLVKKYDSIFTSVIGHISVNLLSFILM